MLNCGRRKLAIRRSIEIPSATIDTSVLQWTTNKQEAAIAKTVGAHSSSRCPVAVAADMDSMMEGMKRGDDIL